jgi:hypothetical protein
MSFIGNVDCEGWREAGARWGVPRENWCWRAVHIAEEASSQQHEVIVCACKT